MINIVSTETELQKQYPLIENEFGQLLAECFNLNLDTGPWLAGGMVRKIYTNKDIGSSDWDIFFHNMNQLAQYLTKFTTDFQKYGLSLIVETQNALTYQIQYKNHTYRVQLIVKKFYDSVEDIFSNFDFSICQLATDGKNIKLGEHTAKDLKNQTLRLTSNIKPDTILYRMMKYTILGFKPTKELYNIMNNPETNIKWSFNYVTYDDI